MPKFLLCLLALFSGCAAIPAVRPAPVSPIVWEDSDYFREGAADWQTVAAQRFKNPIVFACHGGVHREFLASAAGLYVRSSWWVLPDDGRQPQSVESLAQTLANLYPERDIVLVCCNPGGFDLDVPRVWYCRRPVWVIPDTFIKHAAEDGAGSIWEFVSYSGGSSHTQDVEEVVLPHPPTTHP